MYLVGFAGYLLVPAGGPYIAFPEVFAYPVHGGAMTALLAPIILALVVATLYLRYHYGIDVLCGIALAAAVLTLIQRYRKDFPA
jgi:membrane-associated phospholipid phosphatase